jgi:hypothetical protein
MQNGEYNWIATEKRSFLDNIEQIREKYITTENSRRAEDKSKHFPNFANSI